MKKTIESFDHQGVKYDIVFCSDGNVFTVSVYKGNEPANGISYEARILDIHDGTVVSKCSLVEYFAGCAKDDVKEGRWESYKDSLKA